MLVMAELESGMEGTFNGWLLKAWMVQVGGDLASGFWINHRHFVPMMFASLTGTGLLGIVILKGSNQSKYFGIQIICGSLEGTPCHFRAGVRSRLRHLRQTLVIG